MFFVSILKIINWETQNQTTNIFELLLTYFRVWVVNRHKLPENCGHLKEIPNGSRVDGPKNFIDVNSENVKHVSVNLCWGHFRWSLDHSCSIVCIRYVSFLIAHW